MITRLRRLHPSPSMAVAGIALFVALAGTSVAAVSVVLPRNSVGPLQLQPNSVNSAKVQNGSLLKVDFKAGQIPTGKTGPAGPAGAVGPAGPAGAAGAAGVASPGYVAQVLTASATSGSSTSSTSFSDLSNASVNVVVPSGETDQVTAYFSAGSACYGGSQIRTCHVRITVDGNELAPSVGDNSNWDNNDNGVKATTCSASPWASPCTVSNTFNAKTAADYESHAIIRYSGNLAAGTHTVKVQFDMANGSTTLKLTEWSLVVDRIRVA